MTITTFDDLQRWFYAQQRDEKPAAHWNLYGVNYGEKDSRVAFNTRLDEMDASFDFLASTIRQLNHPDGAKFRLQTFPKGAPNNPTAQVNIQIYERAMAPATASVAGLGSTPVGINDVERYVDEKVRVAMLERDNEELRAQINSPANGIERLIALITEIPGIGDVLKVAAAGLVTKLNPAAAPAVAAAMTGTPAAGGHDTDDETEDPQTVFLTNIEQASQTLGVDAVTLARRLNALVQENPAAAKSLLTS